jgi:hypothetical protein
MRAHRPNSVVVVIAVAVLLTIAASPLAAQIIRGKLLDQVGDKPVGGASVTLLTDQNAQAGSAQSSSSGDFTLRAPRAGVYRIRVAKNGYRASETPAIQLQAGDDIGVTMHIIPNKIELSPVVVTANSRRPSGRLGGFYDRMQRKGFGTFITREQIQQRRPFEVTEMLRGIPGLELRPRLRGFGYDVRTIEGCRPSVYLDGVPFPLMGESIDNIVNPMNLEGIEVYTHAVEVPAELQRGLGRCGVIALWTR